MSFNLDEAFGIHEQALLLRSRRAEVLAGNLANADTPGFKARDIDFESTLRAAQDARGADSMKTTRPNHLNMNGEVTDQSASSLGEMLYRQPSQPSVDGNTVDTEVEKAEFMRNAVQYQVSLDLLDSKVKNLLTAIRGE